MDFKKLPRCGAKARSNRGMPCRQAAMQNGRCYYHGGSMIIKHGHATKMAKQQQTKQRALINEIRKTVLSVKQYVNKL
jgi:hypothetical protein